MNLPPQYLRTIFDIAASEPAERDALAEKAAKKFGYKTERVQFDVDEQLRTNEKARERCNGNGTCGDAPRGPCNPLYDPEHRSDLTLSAWLKRELPPRDYLLGELLSTTSRWLVIGETGVGKTLLLLDMAGAIAAGRSFLGWEGRRKARVMYLDGELPQETFKERLELIAARYGTDIELFAYNREYLTGNNPEEAPPLNKPEGQQWLLGEIDKIKPDLIVFDAIMSLLLGNMSEEDSWAPMKDFIRKVTARRIAQVWLHHTGHDTSKGYGTKTREWEMDTVITLTKVDTDADPSQVLAAFQLEFQKARLRTPANYEQFATKIIHDTANGFIFKDTSVRRSSKTKSEPEIIKGEFNAAYDRLVRDVGETPDDSGMLVKKVGVNAIRDELKANGYLDTGDKDQITGSARTMFRRAKSELLVKGDFVEKDGLVWRPSEPM